MRLKVEVENWKAVVGFEGRYEVSDRGRVRSVARTDGLPGRPRDGRVLRLKSGKYGYLRVGLYSAEKQVFKQVHRLVAEAHIGAPPEGRPQINHKDVNKANNWVWNLEWVSALENMAHAAANGRLNCLDGIRASKILSKPVVLEVRRLSGEGLLNCKEIADLLGLAHGTVLDVVCEKVWRKPGASRTPLGRGRTAVVAPGKSRGLTLEKAREIRAMRAGSGMLYREIAEVFGVEPSTIGSVVRGESWLGPIT